MKLIITPNVPTLISPIFKLLRVFHRTCLSSSNKIPIGLGIAINSLYRVLRVSSDMPEVTTHFKEKKI